MSDKKKVYVETTVVSDATALPTNDLSLAGRQMIPKIKQVCADNGYRCAEICTPQMLQEGGTE